METKLTKEEQSEIKQERERGASLVEYGILVALIAGISIIAIQALAGSVTNAFTTTTDQVNAAVNANGGGNN